jgi:RNA polymerase sigma-70 factor (ECF subfamily)
MPESQKVLEFVRLLTSHEVRLRAFVLSMIPNFADAEDVLQQTNAVLWERFDQFQPGTSFMSWAGRVAYLEALQHLRRRRTDKNKFGEAFLKNVADVALREEVDHRLNARIVALGECVAKLKPKQRDMLRARYFEKRTIEQMEQVFSRSAEAIYQTLSRIRRTLHDCVSMKVRLEAVDDR